MLVRDNARGTGISIVPNIVRVRADRARTPLFRGKKKTFGEDNGINAAPPVSVLPNGQQRPCPRERLEISIDNPTKDRVYYRYSSLNKLKLFQLLEIRRFL